jgi:hypothetical protein
LSTMRQHIISMENVAIWKSTCVLRSIGWNVRTMIEADLPPRYEEDDADHAPIMRMTPPEGHKSTKLNKLSNTKQA